MNRYKFRLQLERMAGKKKKTKCKSTETKLIEDILQHNKVFNKSELRKMIRCMYNNNYTENEISEILNNDPIFRKIRNEDYLGTWSMMSPHHLWIHELITFLYINIKQKMVSFKPKPLLKIDLKRRLFQPDYEGMINSCVYSRGILIEKKHIIYKEPI